MLQMEAIVFPSNVFQTKIGEYHLDILQFSVSWVKIFDGL